MSLRLYLVRHGESEWNRSCRYSGQRDIPLSQRGRDQARRLAYRLAAEELDAIYASPLQRARETASIIADERKMPVILDAGLQEIDHGAWQGMTTSEVALQFPSEYALWQLRPHVVTMPRGEALSHVVHRVQDLLGRLDVQQRQGNLVLCSHDAILRVLVLTCLEMGLQHFWKLCFENACLSMLERQDQSGRWRLVYLNDTSHLTGICSDYTAQAL